MDDLDRMLVYGAALPFVLACALVIPLSKRCDGQRDRHAWRIVLAVGLPVVIAFAMLFDWPRGQNFSLETWWSNITQDQLVLYAVISGIVVGLFMSVTPRKRWLRVVSIVVLAGLVALVTWPIVKPEPWYYRAVPAVGTLLFAGSLEFASARRCGFCAPLGMSIALGVSAVVVVVTGYQKLGTTALAGAVALGVISLLAMWRPKTTIGDGVSAVIAPLIVMPPLFAWLYVLFNGDDFPAAGYLLPMLAPLALLIGDAPKLKDAKPWIRNVVVLALVVAMCGTGVAAGFWPGESEVLLDEMGFPIDP